MSRAKGTKKVTNRKPRIPREVYSQVWFMQNLLDEASDELLIGLAKDEDCDEGLHLQIAIRGLDKLRAMKINFKRLYELFNKYEGREE